MWDTTTGNHKRLFSCQTTKYTRTDTAIPLKDIKVGARVMIQATKNDDQLTAAKVKFGGSGTNHHGS